jgi:hypothetical protein
MQRYHQSANWITGQKQLNYTWAFKMAVNNFFKYNTIFIWIPHIPEEHMPQSVRAYIWQSFHPKIMSAVINSL